METMNKKVLFVVLITLVILAGVFFLSQLILPEYAEMKIKQALTDYFEDYSSLEVQVEARPAFKLLQERADSLKISGSRIKSEGLYFDSFYAFYTDLKIEEDQVTGYMEILELVLLARDLNEYLEPHDIELFFEPGSVRARTAVEIFGSPVDVMVRGGLSIREEKYLVFSPTGVILEGLEIPGGWIENILERVRLEIDLDRFPLPFRVQEVNVGQDKLILKAD